MLPSNQTIVALCTPQGSGAIALIRLSGNQSIAIVDRFSKLVNKQKLIDQATHTVHLGKVIDQDGQTIDQVMFIVMHSPRTFTGENVVEITCHNNPFIIDQIISLAIANGARPALKGEFSQQAFLNDKLDLSQVEAINSLIHAHTEAALKKSLAQLDGSLSHWTAQIEKKLLKCIALAEASFEFIEEEVDFAPQINEELSSIIEIITKAKSAYGIQQQIREGFRIALIGTVNAGKSSLFNALLNKERAIVTPIAGTTRDVIEAGIYTKTHYLTIVDTAGLRQTNDQIEKIGIERSLAEAKTADIILLVFDVSRPITDMELIAYQEIYNQYLDKIIVVCNKNDLPNQITLPKELSKPIHLSTKLKQNLNELDVAINSKIESILAQDTSPFLLNQRQLNVFNLVAVSCHKILKMLACPEYELISLHLNEVIQILSSISGKTVTEDSLETIFREFCVGK